MAKFKRAASSQSPAQSITAAIIEKLEQGTKPWIKPWRGQPVSRPLRACGTPYRGMNGELGERRIEGGVSPGDRRAGTGKRDKRRKDVVAALDAARRLGRNGSLDGHGEVLRGLNNSQQCVRCMFFPLP